MSVSEAPAGPTRPSSSCTTPTASAATPMRDSHPDPSYPATFASSNDPTKPAAAADHRRKKHHPAKETVRSNTLDPTLQALSLSKLAPYPTPEYSQRSVSPAGRFRKVFRKTNSSSSIFTTSSSRPESRSRTTDADSGLEATEPSATSSLSSRHDYARQSSPAIASFHLISPSVTDLADRNRPSSRDSKSATATAATAATSPLTIPHAEHAPTIVNTPPTPINPSESGAPPTPTRDASSRPRPDATVSSDLPKSSESKSDDKAGERPTTSSSSVGPTKPSETVSSPQTPHDDPADQIDRLENQSSGFLSSVISVVQNTASTLTMSIGTTGLGPSGTAKNKTASPSPKASGTIPADATRGESSNSEKTSMRESTFTKNFSTGDLRLGPPAMADSQASVPSSPSLARGPHSADPRGRSDSAPVENGTELETIEDEALSTPPSRPISVHDLVSAGVYTPPPASVYEGKSSIHRNGSIKSAIERHRKRGSSAASGKHAANGMGIGAALAAANAAVGTHPGAMASAHKLTGFAVASKKRNRDFHNIFKSVPDDDYLIEDYSCALQREILAHGRLYVSEGHLCFSSNIFGWVNTLVMSFDEIVSVEKRSTALVFKNGLEISTPRAKHIFASFTSRDSTYDLIVKIWKLSHPNLTSSLNGVRLDDTGGDKTEKVDVASAHGSPSSSITDGDDESDVDDDDIYDEDDEEMASPEDLSPSELPSHDASTDNKGGLRKSPGSGLPATVATADKPDQVPAANPTAADFPGPAFHPPTDCADTVTHFDKVLADEIVPAPLGKIYNLLFGPGSAVWMTNFLTNDQRCADVQIGDRRGLTEANKTRGYTFVKPLNAPIGPKQTKCIVTEELLSLDLDKSVVTLCVSQNPDVPSGNIFSVKTKYCLTWAENNATRVQVSCLIDWAGKSWLKGPIEKGINDGQAQYSRELFAALRAAVSAHPRSAHLTTGGTIKKKKRKGKSAISSSPTGDDAAVASIIAAGQNWGPLEPLRPVLGPVVEIFKPVLSINVVFGLLFGLFLVTWVGRYQVQSSMPYAHNNLALLAHPDRLAAYEEIWRREESQLWDWLEERVGLSCLNEIGAPLGCKRSVEPTIVKDRLRHDRMHHDRMEGQELREAIRVTEEKLSLLKSLMKIPGE